ncbi:Uncharacterised protein [uncultured archaeon]|nr:Uncharacterised protein [uncultured archaeon]
MSTESKWDKTKVVIRTQKEIDEYNRTIGHRRARRKRYDRYGSK